MMEISNELKNKKKRTTVEKQSATEVGVGSSSQPLVKNKKKKKKDLLIYFTVVYSEYDPENPQQQKDHLECYDWYVFNPLVTPSQQYQKLSPTTRLLTPLVNGYRSPHAVRSVFLNSKLYVFKSYPRNISTNFPPTHVSVYDTITQDWVHNYPFPRFEMDTPKLLTCGGKIFLFSSIFAKQHWGHVFDPIQNTLNPLPTPAELSYTEQTLHVCTYTVIDEGRFLVCFGMLLPCYIFDVYSSTWTSIQIPLTSLDDDDNQMIYTSGILYLFDGLDIFAYNLAQGGDSLIEVKGLKLPSGFGPIGEPDFCIHRGKNKFSLIWTPDDHDQAGYGLNVIHCMNFRVDSVVDHQGQYDLEATVDGCSSYLVDGGFIHDCVAVECNRSWIVGRCEALKI